jgi:hypothetical protein
MSHPYKLSAVAVTPDKRYIIAGGDNIAGHPGRILYWDFATGQFLRADPWEHYALARLLVTPDGKTLVSCGRNDRAYSGGGSFAYATDIASGQRQRLNIPVEFSYKLWLTEDQNYVMIDDFRWDWRNGGDPVCINPLPATRAEEFQREGQKAMFQSNHIHLAGGMKMYCEKKAYVLRDANGAEVRTMNPGHDYEHWQSARMKVTPDGRYLLGTMGTYVPRATEQNIRLGLWDIEAGQLLREFRICPYGMILDLDLTGDGQQAVALVYNPETMIRVFDLTTGEVRLEIVPEEKYA